MVVSTLTLSSGVITELDDDEGFLTLGEEVRFLPEAQITASKDDGNPTFNFDAIPESIVKVGATYYCVYGFSAVYTTFGLATATDRDGPWTASTTIFSTPGWATGYNMYAPFLMEDAGTFYLFYSAIIPGGSTSSLNAIGVATSSTVNGTYTDYGAPILSPGVASSPTSRRVGEVSVLHYGGQWLMAFMGEDSDIAVESSEKVFMATATGPTGPWTVLNSGNPVLDFGASGEWDDTLIADPHLFLRDGYLWMMYAGGGSNTVSHDPWQQGLAYCDPADLTTWTRYADNPILIVGESGAWDEGAAWRGSIWDEDGALGGVYGGFTPAFVYRGGNFRLNITGAGIVAPTPIAADIDITDSGGYYTGTEVETALQEIGASLAAIDTGETIAASGAVGELILSDTASTPPVFGDILTNEDETDFMYGDLA